MWQHERYYIRNIMHCYGSYKTIHNLCDEGMDLCGKREIILIKLIKNVERNELNTQINVIITSIIFLKDEAIVMVG
jgi:hypothetical protein